MGPPFFYQELHVPYWNIAMTSHEIHGRVGARYLYLYLYLGTDFHVPVPVPASREQEVPCTCTFTCR